MVVEIFEFEVGVWFWPGKLGLGVTNEVGKIRKNEGVEGMWVEGW